MSVSQSIIVPCYNEGANIPNLIGRFEALANGGPVDWELILVNNGSVDDSAAIFERELAKPGRSFARVVTVPSPNVGYGHGITTGLRAARGEYLGWTHADGQTPPSDVLRAFELLRSSADPKRTFVKGRRRNRPVKDALFTLGMQATAGAILGLNLDDINGQPKAFHRTLLELASSPPVDLSLDLYFFWVAKKNGFELRTFDVHFGDREHGESKWAFNWRSKARNIARSVKFMSALRSGTDYPRA
ncbi:glycosyltransferase family 2 protein [Pendulispora albinea]|uniref:Glycosyltransferase family 2 protein n=1 Tax=Pendulispora albinea TaxID=2741071 RepID=A0ABZ2LKI5_9BACT